MRRAASLQRMMGRVGSIWMLPGRVWLLRAARLAGLYQLEEPPLDVDNAVLAVEVPHRHACAF
jgi:hypothetical protein